MTGPLLAVDGPFLMYRSFFAMPASITGTDGRPVGALLGATNVLLRAIADFRPRAVVLSWGAEAGAYRVALFEGYHAARPPVPDALAWQFAHAPKLFAALGWESRSAESLEADDVLGELARVEAAAGGRALLLTGDRDMFQCASAAVSVLLLRPGKAGFEQVGPAEVRARYGIDPAQVPDFIALRGDPSDGLPGAPGIGEKTAAEILGRFGSLEAALAAVGDEATPALGRGLRPRVAASLRENAEMLRAYREIATLQPVPGQARPSDAPTDLEGGAAAAERLGMRALARRLREPAAVDK